MYYTVLRRGGSSLSDVVRTSAVNELSSEAMNRFITFVEQNKDKISEVSEQFLMPASQGSL